MLKEIEMIKIASLLCLLFLIAQAKSGEKRDVSSHYKTKDHEIYVGTVETRPSTTTKTFFQVYSQKKHLLNDSASPLLIWVDGETGCSGVNTAHYYFGPFQVRNNSQQAQELYPNPNAFTDFAHILIFDQPVGTGFSVVNDFNYTNTSQEAAKDFEASLVDFFQLFPELKRNPLYLFGEGVGGHFIAVFARHLRKNEATTGIKLKGIVFNDAWIDPLNQGIEIAKTSYYAGIVSMFGRNEFHNTETDFFLHIKEEKYQEASAEQMRMLGSYTLKTGTQYFNWRLPYSKIIPDEHNPITLWLNSSTTKTAFGISDSFVYSRCNTDIDYAMMLDQFHSVSGQLSSLISDLPILLMQGQDDMLVNVDGAFNMIVELNWPDTEKWSRVPKKFLKSPDSQVLGYSKTFNFFTFCFLNNAGFYLGQDQPSSAYQMIRQWLLSL